MEASFSLQSELGMLLMGLAPPRGLATHCNIHCIMCVAQGIRGPRWLDVIPTFLLLTKAVSSDTYNRQRGLRSLIHLRKPFKRRADDSRAAPVQNPRRGPQFLGACIWISSPGEVPRLESNWTTWSTAYANSRLFLWVLSLRSYFPGGRLNALALPPEGSMLPIASLHCLGRGIQGYLQFC